MFIWLIHGAYHGSWCWTFLRPELETLGHRVHAVDLPIEDPNAGAARYAATINEAIDRAATQAGSEVDRDPLVILAHSMSGVVVPLVAAQRRIERIIFLCALLPKPGMSLSDQRAAETVDAPVTPTTAEWTDLGDDVWMVGPRTATEVFFHDAPPDRAAWAVRQLRPQAYRFMHEITPLTAWPDVRSDYILCRDDHSTNPAWSRQAARDRLGVSAIELDGGHSPFLTRPVELARTIESLLRG